MNIRKQYIKPNCTLTLDGFDENAPVTEAEFEQEQACISVITNAECVFTTSNQRLTGDRTFVENLASAASNYAQEFLSGLSHPQDEQKEYPQIKIFSSDRNGEHNIVVQPDPQEGDTKQEITLKTTELFDLVDVIDSFYTDGTSLPDVTLELEVVGKKFRQSDEPLAQRVIPVVTGTLSLAIAAGLFFILPTPKIEEPQNPIESIPTLPIPSTPEAIEEEIIEEENNEPSNSEAQTTE